MGQVDHCTSVATQLLTQLQTQYSDQTVAASSKDDGGTDFQSLLEQKCKVTSDSTTTPKEAGKSDKKSAVQQPKEQSAEQSEEDPVVREMACAEMVIADSVVMLNDLPEPQQADATAPISQQISSVTADLPEQTVEQTAEPIVTAEPEVQVQTQMSQTQVAQTETTLPETQEAAQPTTKLETQAETPQTQTETVDTSEQQAVQDVSKVGQAEETAPQEEDVFSSIDSGSKAKSNADAAMDADADQDENDPTVTVNGGEGAAQPIFRQVETNMVKVGEAEPTEESQQADDVNQQIADQLTTSLEQGETKVEIKLSPSSLGNVTVEVTAQENGALHIALSADNGHTKLLLEQHVANLQNLVSGQTQRPVQVEVSQRQENQQSNLQYDDQNGRGGYQQQQRQQQSQQDESFLQKLRLGLLPLNVEATE